MFIPVCVTLYTIHITVLQRWQKICSKTWGHLRLRSDIKLCTSATWTHQWMWDIFLHKMILPEELRENMSTWPSVLSQWAFLRLYACAVKQTYLLKNWACWAFRERRRWQNILRTFLFIFLARIYPNQHMLPNQQSHQPFSFQRYVWLWLVSFSGKQFCVPEQSSEVKTKEKVEKRVIIGKWTVVFRQLRFSGAGAFWEMDVCVCVCSFSSPPCGSIEIWSQLHTQIFHLSRSLIL